MQKKLNIKEIVATQVLDSRGNPTIQVEVVAGEHIGIAIVPSGASTGSFEAVEIRDNEEKYNGKSVEKAVKNVNKKIAPMLEEENIYEQKKLDQIMIDLDGTENKKNLGANAILGVSLAIAKCAANSIGIPLYKYIGGIRADRIPIPMMNILNGGKHSENNLSIQEFMIVPNIGKKFEENLRAGVEIYNKLKKILKQNQKATGVGDEGGFAPDLLNEEEALEYICKAIYEAGYTPGKNVFLALDVAATELYEEAKKIGEGGNYYFWKKEELKSKKQMVEYLIELAEKYPIISIEDGLAEEDWDTWQELTKKLSTKINLVGDDLFVTNKKRLQKGIKEKVANSILIKPNQIGTLTETLSTIEYAQKNGYEIIISHRSGETEDTFIADLAVGTNAKYIKAGAPCRTDRVAKYNRLLNIENKLL